MSQPGPIVPGQGPQKGPAEKEIVPNSEKFKQQMTQVGAVESTDPEQQAKKKQQMLGDEEESDETQTAPPSPFSLNDTPTTTLLSGQAGTEAPMSVDSAAPSSYIPVGVAPENADDLFNQSLPPPIENESDIPSTSSFEETDTTPEPLPSQKSTSPEPPQKTSEGPLISKTQVPSPKAALKAQKGKGPKTLKTVSAPLKSQVVSAKSTKTAAGDSKASSPKGFGVEEPKESSSPVTTPSTASKPKKSVKMDMEAETAQVSPQGIPFPMDQAPPQPAQNPLGSYLSPEVHELFQTMVGLVIMKNLKAEGLEGTRMEVSLNNTDYENSPFYNLKIVITEYQTAPGRYNIELQGNASQNTLLQKNVGNLFSSLNDPRYNLPFTVNRVDVTVKGEDKDFLFKRKESVKGGQKDMHDRPKQ